jgi:predicted TIM-barrel fold metal-dependent hydrolase
MIIDCHTHLNNYSANEENSLERCIENLEEEMRKNRVDLALVLTSYKVNACRPDTRTVLRAIQNRKHLAIVAGVQYSELDSKQVSELREFLQGGLVKGRKLYPGYEPFYPHDPKLEVIYDLAAEFQVPVMIHSGDTFSPQAKIKYAHPIHVDEVAVDHPNVNFVICHLGNPWFYETLEIVYKNKNVYTDISGLVLGKFSDRFERFMASKLQELILLGIESDKVLFGTDWPISSMESYLSLIQNLALPEKDKRKILFENSAKLFKIQIEEPFTKSINSFFKLWRDL